MLVLQAVPAGNLNAFKLLRARIREASTWSDQFYLTEKFIGRLIGWFEGELLSINIQFVAESPASATRRKR